MGFFFFGTMRDEDVRALVIGRPLSGLEAATLAGYRLARVVDESYPAPVPDAAGRIEGVRVRRLTAGEVARVVWFEGVEYDFRTVEVTLGNGDRATVKTQMPTERLEIAGGDWDFARWRRTEKGDLMSLAHSHMALFGRATPDEAARVWDETRESLRAAR